MMSATCDRCTAPFPAEGRGFVLAVHQQPVRVSPVVGAIAEGPGNGNPVGLVCQSCLSLLVEELRRFVVRRPAADDADSADQDDEAPLAYGATR